MSNSGGGDDVDKFLSDLDREADQDKAVAENRGSFLTEAPPEDVLLRRAREYDDLPKHLVRVYHWLKVAQGLYKVKGGGLKLLTLPGRYALEVGLYYKKGLLDQVTMDGDTTAVAVVAFETSPEVFGLLRSGQPRLWRLFDGDLIATLNDNGSARHKELVQLFPFDIINLDLTINLVAPSEGPYGPVPAAIRECFKLQGAQPNDWALMLTFRAGLAETDPTAIELWRKEYQDNLDQHVAVKDACFQTYARSTVAELFELDGEEALGQCAAKWIADQAHAADWRIVSARHLRYARSFDGGCYTIRKVVFRFSRSKLPQYVMPGKATPVVAWHVDDLVNVVKNCRSEDIDRFLEKLRKSKAAWVQKLTEEIEALKAFADGASAE